MGREERACARSIRGWCAGRTRPPAGRTRDPPGSKGVLLTGRRHSVQGRRPTPPRQDAVLPRVDRCLADDRSRHPPRTSRGFTAHDQGSHRGQDRHPPRMIHGPTAHRYEADRDGSMGRPAETLRGCPTEAGMDSRRSWVLPAGDVAMIPMKVRAFAPWRQGASRSIPGRTRGCLVVYRVQWRGHRMMDASDPRSLLGPPAPSKRGPRGTTAPPSPCKSRPARPWVRRRYGAEPMGRRRSPWSPVAPVNRSVATGRINRHNRLKSFDKHLVRPNGCDRQDDVECRT